MTAPSSVAAFVDILVAAPDIHRRGRRISGPDCGARQETQVF
jgi:hypothetical protein